jgi:hypothetical protein
MKKISEKELEVRVAALAAMSPTELREEWGRVWGTKCYSHNYALLRRRIKWRLYALCHGPLAATALKKAEELADFSQLRERAPSCAPCGQTAVVTKKMPQSSRRWNQPAEGSIIDQMAAHPGAYLTRAYKGHSHIVYSLGDSRYSYEGTIYGSLSAVATKIAGYNVSGNRFFTADNTQISIVQ